MEPIQKLKEISTSTPTLAYPHFTKPFKLHTDACMLALGAILYQNQDGIDGVIGYVSKVLEHRYLAHKLKFLALKWAIA